MQLTIEINDRDLGAIFSKMKSETDWFMIDRYNNSECEAVRRLLAVHVISQLPHYGGQMCYHPKYMLTKIGHLAWHQWKERSNKPPEHQLYCVCLYGPDWVARFYVRAESSRQACEFIRADSKESWEKSIEMSAEPVDDSPGMILRCV